MFKMPITKSYESYDSLYEFWKIEQNTNWKRLDEIRLIKIKNLWFISIYYDGSLYRLIDLNVYKLSNELLHDIIKDIESYMQMVLFIEHSLLKTYHYHIINLLKPFKI